jgi:hypothetical protein
MCPDSSALLPAYSQTNLSFAFSTCKDDAPARELQGRNNPGRLCSEQLIQLMTVKTSIGATSGPDRGSGERQTVEPDQYLGALLNPVAFRR